MSKRYDICQPQRRGEKTFWNRFAVMWESDDGKRSIVFESLPLPQKNDRTGEIEVRAMVFEAKPRDGAPRQSAPTGGGGYSDADYGARDSDDDIPF
jgi:hypothetical protein